MNDSDVNKIVQLRSHLINEYKKLNNPTFAPNAIISEKEVAVLLVTTIRSLEDLISDKVNFS